MRVRFPPRALNTYKDLILKFDEFLKELWSCSICQEVWADADVEDKKCKVCGNPVSCIAQIVGPKCQGCKEEFEYERYQNESKRLPDR